eukprot:5831157-Amphidinium_carterae.1
MSKIVSTNGFVLLFVRKLLLCPKRYWYAIFPSLECAAKLQDNALNATRQAVPAMSSNELIQNAVQTVIANRKSITTNGIRKSQIELQTVNFEEMNWESNEKRAVIIVVWTVELPLFLLIHTVGRGS